MAPFCQYCESELCTDCSDDGTGIAQCNQCDSDANGVPHFVQADTCVTECEAGFYDNGGVCSPCETDCEKCNDDVTCTKCNAGVYLYQADCIATCPVGSPAQTDSNSIDICGPCHSSCATCVSTTATDDCVTCSSASPTFSANEAVSDP